MKGPAVHSAILKTLLVLAFAGPAPLPAANFSMPYVDLVPNLVSSDVMMAIWSSTDGFVTKTTGVNVTFPPDISIPAGLNPAGCQCIFMKHSSTTAGAWAALEVTITAGSYPGTGQMVSLSLPADIHPGKFYLRFDTTAGLQTSAIDGIATVALSDPNGNVTVSQGYYVRPTYSAAAAMGVLSGTVKTSAGVPLPGALVMATTSGIFPPEDLGPRNGSVEPMGTSTNAYTTAARSDGSYSMSLPPGVYSARAEVQNHKADVANSSYSSPVAATIVPDGTTPVSFSLTPLP